MSKLEEMLAELCPEGVAYMPLENIAVIKARIGWQGLTKKEYLNSGDYYLVTGVDFKNNLVDWNNCHYVTRERYEQDVNIQLKNDDVLVTKDGTLGKVAYVKDMTKPATLNSGVFVIRSKTDLVINKFLYYYLNSSYLMKFANSKLTGGTIKHLNQSVITQLPVPLPPVEIQAEIVRILDNFAELTIELERELQARKKQYAYYRDMLLDFGIVCGEGIVEADRRTNNICLHEVKFLAIECLCKTISAKVKIKSHDYIKNGKYPVIDQGKNFIGGYTNENSSFPLNEYIVFGDHTCIVKYVNFAFVQGADGVKVLLVDKSIIIPKYLFYCMCNIHIDVDYARHWSKMKKETVPVPSLEEQKRIVKILDKFDKLCHDISEGLPAEIKARQKQYAYYRDRILDFRSL